MAAARGSLLALQSLACAASLGALTCSPAPKTNRAPEHTSPAPDIAKAPAAPLKNLSFQREIHGKKLKLVFHADPLPNLVYQLDCMAGRHPCSRAAYESLWKEQLGFQDEDSRALDSFRAARERFQGRLEIRNPHDLSPLPLPRADRTIASRLAIASLLSHTPDEHISYLSLVSTPTDAKRTQSLIDHFRPRFDLYWQREGKTLAESAAHSLASLFEKENLVEYVEDLAAFYESDLPDGATLDFHLMARPTHPSLDAAHQIGNHAVIEIPQNEDPKNRAPIVIHEILHHLYAAAPDEHLATLSRSFLETNDPLATPGHAVLDEALATALGTAPTLARLDPAAFAKKMADPLGLYAEHTIDHVAKAIRPLLTARLAAKQSLYAPHFAAQYLAALHAAYPQGMPPIAHARPLIAALEPQFWSAFHALDAASMASSLGGATATDALDAPNTPTLFTDHPAFAGAFFISHAALPHLTRFESHIGKEALAAIKAEAAHTRAFVYSTEYTPGVYRFIFVADDPTAMEHLVRALAAQPNPFEGTLEVLSATIAPH